MKSIVNLIFGILALFCVAHAAGGGELAVPMRSPEDLLRIMKDGVDSHLFAKAEFYEERRIRDVFGDSKVLIKPRPERHATIVDIYGFPFSKASGGAIDTSLRITKLSHPNGEIGVYLDLDSTAPNPPDFDTIESIFGKDWKPVEQIPNPHEVIPPTTHRNGNARISFEYRAGGLPVRVSLRFNRDARLSSATIELGRVD